MPQVPAHAPRFARFRRRLFNLLAVLSLALWLALVVLWVDTRLLGNVRTLYNRPIYAADGVSIHGRVVILCWKDGFLVQVGENRAFAGMGTRFDHWAIPGASLMRMSGRSRGYEGQFSHWFGILMLGLPISGWLIWLRMMWRRRRRYGAGLCDRCGYDLRATPDRCPECGTEAKPQPA